jgi:hypothetical protein
VIAGDWICSNWICWNGCSSIKIVHCPGFSTDVSSPSSSPVHRPVQSIVQSIVQSSPGFSTCRLQQTANRKRQTSNRITSFTSLRQLSSYNSCGFNWFVLTLILYTANNWPQNARFGVCRLWSAEQVGKLTEHARKLLGFSADLVDFKDINRMNEAFERQFN